MFGFGLIRLNHVQAKPQGVEKRSKLPFVGPEEPSQAKS